MLSELIEVATRELLQKIDQCWDVPDFFHQVPCGDFMIYLFFKFFQINRIGCHLIEGLNEQVLFQTCAFPRQLAPKRGDPNAHAHPLQGIFKGHTGHGQFLCQHACVYAVAALSVHGKLTGRGRKCDQGVGRSVKLTEPFLLQTKGDTKRIVTAGIKDKNQLAPSCFACGLWFAQYFGHIQTVNGNIFWATDLGINANQEVAPLQLHAMSGVIEKYGLGDVAG